MRYLRGRHDPPPPPPWYLMWVPIPLVTEGLKKAQLSFLRRELEIPRSVRIAVSYLELCILPIKCETEMRQHLFLEKILDKSKNASVSRVYQEMIKYGFENNWAYNVLDLRVKYSLPLNDEDFGSLPKGVMVKKKQVKPMHFLI